MPEEQVGGVPEDVAEWLSRRAAETDQEPEEVLTRAVGTYRLLDEHEGRVRENGETAVEPLDDRLEGVEPRLDDAEERLDGLAARLDQHESATESDVADLRERVIQVLQTAQSKADADHDHESLDARLADVEVTVGSLEETVEALEPTVASVETELERLDEDVAGGFENFEAILEGLADSIDDAAGKLDSLAAAAVDLRSRVADLDAARAQRTAAEELQAEANREGVGAADCEQCGGSVDVALLGTPRCPHCSGVFTGLSPGRRFFGRATLEVGDRPALTGESMAATDPNDLFEDDE